jgi:dihydrofolate reductase
MRKIIVLEHISLDGIIQAPGGPDEDTSGSFTHGGWISSYSDVDIWSNVNIATKYVASNTRTFSNWQPSVFLSGDIAEKVANIKQQQGSDLHVWGSGNLVQTLIKHDLVDTFWLMIYPITLGAGKRLFTNGTIPMTFKVTESKVTSSGVIVMNYERASVLNSK